MKLTTLICSTGLALLLAVPAMAQGMKTEKVADAKPGDVRVYVTASIKVPLDSVTEQAKKAIGKNIVFEYGGARGNLKDEIMAGNGDFEVAMLLPDVNQTLLAAGKIKSGSYPIARILVAFGIRGNAAVDVSSQDAIKKTLLAATSVKYAPTGAGAQTAENVLNVLKIADKVKNNSKTREEVPLTGNQYEINIYPQSEIVANKKLKNLGPVIASLQLPLSIEATIGKNTRDEAGAMALIKFLQGPTIDAALKENYIEKGKMVASK